MATWILPFNPNYYKAVEALDSLKKINWGQTTNITPKDIVYIYRTSTEQALVARCRVNVSELPVTNANDSEFVLDDRAECRGNRFLEVELLEKLHGQAYSLEELKKHGFAIYGGPIRMVDSLKQYVDKLSVNEINNKRFSVLDAVWIAAAAYAFFQYKKMEICTLEDCSLKASELIKLVEQFAMGKVNAARIYQWCNGDHGKQTYNYLRKVGGDKSVSFRVTAAGEFGDKEYPDDINWEEKISYEGEGVLLKELKDFVEGPYVNLPKAIEDTENEYWPSLDVYDPKISTEKWAELLRDDTVTKKENLAMFKYMLKMGGKATCAGLSERYGNTSEYYNGLGTNFSNRVYQATQCELCKRKNGQDIFYTIPFVGRNVMENGHDRFEWKLRDELRKALKKMDLSDIKDSKPKKNTEYAKNMILYGPPGTGKTYSTAIYAVAICDGLAINEVKNWKYKDVMARFKELKAKDRIYFTTFHQSYGYEEFIEGIKPYMDNNDDDDNIKELKYSVKPGVFKRFCERADIASASPNGVTVDYGFNRDPVVWKVSLRATGDNPIRKECMENGHIRIGWEDYGKELSDDVDYSKCGGKNILNAFFNRMRKGDIVFSCYSQSTIDAIGVVTGDPDWNDDFPEYKRFRNVKWLVKNMDYDIVAINNGAVMKQGAIYRLYIPISEVYKILNQELGKFKNNQNNYKEIEKFVFVIDEINRGNISKIFGELITLIEESKRGGMPEEMKVLLPYSQDSFSVPSNVYILGTMNTADRSIALMDTALRRRFQFIEMMPDYKVLEGINVEGLNVAKLLKAMNDRIEYLYDREHTIGHAFFTSLKDEKNRTLEKLGTIFEKSIIPLLQEYFYDDYQKIQLVLGDNAKDIDDYKFILIASEKAADVFMGDVNDLLDLPENKYEINKDAFYRIESYLGIANNLDE